MKTLLLDTQAWDLVLDASGNIAAATRPYATAQNVASALRTFKQDCWYDQGKGMPYWQKILGKFPPVSLVKLKLKQEALTIDGAVDANIQELDVVNRQLTGNVMVTDVDGNKLEARF